MAGWFEDLPFARGTTYFGIGGTVVTTAGDASYQFEGREFIVADVDPSNPRLLRSNRLVTLRIVRNSSGGAIAPKQCVELSANGRTIANQSRVDNVRAYPVDEFLPSAGVPNGDLCYVVTKGPAMCSTAGGADVTNLITAKDMLNAVTAAASTNATLSGRVNFYQATTANTGPTLLNILKAAVGQAISARTTANTNVDILVDVGLW